MTERNENINIAHRIADIVRQERAHGAGMTAVRLEALLATVADVAYAQGKIDALMGIRTAEQLAEEFGVSPRRMRAVIKTRHGRWATGMKIGNTWVVSADEVEGVRPGPVGRPPRATKR